MGHAEVWGRAGESLMVVALTGGIASGKTEVSRHLQRLGATVIDADLLARDVTAPGSPVLEAIAKEFGSGVIGRDGSLDRQALASEVFGDERSLKVLNSLTHPAIFSEMHRRVDEAARSLTPGTVPAVVIDAALIVDAGVSNIFDLVVVVTADAEKRVVRMAENRGMSEEEARSRIAAQVPDSKRLQMADIVIENDGTLEELRSSVEDAWRDIERRSRAIYCR